VAGRAQAFSDPRVIRLAAEAFIPVAENSSSLERQQDDKGAFFRHVAEQGHYGGRTYPTATRQGSYAFTAEGQFLASVNTREAVGMEGMLRTALDRWRAGYRLGGPSPVQIAATDVEDGGYPEGGLVLEVAADDWRKVAWNLDYAWITRDEARTLVPERRAVGARRAAPRAVIRRLARFHLRDFVRGEPFAWPEAAIRHAELVTEIAAVGGDTIGLVLRGRVHLEYEAGWVRPEDGEERRYPSGYDCTLYGEATWDDARRAFVAFDLAAAGPRWGASQYNNREDDLGPAPLGIAFALAGDAPSDHTPPHCLRSWRRTDEGARSSRVIVPREEYFGIAGEAG
jgi:hypothetical protein